MSAQFRRLTPVSVYRLLLLCYPPGFREEFGDQMADCFGEQYREARTRTGITGVLALWFGVLYDLLTVAFTERMFMLIQDLRFSLRTLRKSPSFTVVAVATLALGIGAATSIFSVINGVLLNPLPFRDPDRIAMVYLNGADRGLPRMNLSMADFIDWRTHDKAFHETAAVGTFGRYMTLNGLGEPERAAGMYATSGLFSVLGVRPILGRVFEPGDDQPGRARTLVLSERLWRRLGGNPGMVGSTVNVNGEGHTIIGIVPASFRFPNRDTEAWAILPLTPATFRGPYYLRAVGRLRPEISPEQAEAQLRAVPLSVRNGARPDQQFLKFTVVPLQEQIVGDVRPMLVLLLASVGLLLLIAMTNVASLQITRSAARAREFATRLSIGAGRWHIARQQLVESLTIGVTGGLLGVAFAYAAVGLLRWAAPANLPRIEEVSVDGTVLAFALVVSLLSGLVFGLFPALRASGRDLASSLNEGGRSGTQGRERGQLRTGLAAAQIALSCVLLICAGLLIRSFVALQQVSTGIDSPRLLTVQVSPSGSRYSDDLFTRNFYRQLLEGVRSIPGVQSASVSNSVPAGQSGFSENVTIEGAGEEDNPILLEPVVDPEYFRTMSIPLLAGRYFTESDSAGSARVTIISETLARRYFPNQTAIGKRIKIGGRERPNAPRLEIVGVVGDVRYAALDKELEPVFYVPHAQNTVRSMVLVVRSSLPPPSLRTALRQQVSSLDNSIPVPEPTRMDDLLHESVAQQRLRTILIAVFAMAALLVAAVGLYGVIAYSVVQRLQEIGIRIALGAQPHAVSSMILREAVLIGVVGISAGVALALAARKLVSGFLFGVTADDAPTFGAVIVVLLVACLLASYIPARRASRVDPMISIRTS